MKQYPVTPPAGGGGVVPRTRPDGKGVERRILRRGFGPSQFRLLVRWNFSCATMEGCCAGLSIQPIRCRVAHEPNRSVCRGASLAPVRAHSFIWLGGERGIQSRLSMKPGRLNSISATSGRSAGESNGADHRAVLLAPDPVFPATIVKPGRWLPLGALHVVIALLLLIPLAARANPVMLDGQSALAFAAVAFWALVVESSLVTLVLVSTGVLIVPLFFTLIAANTALFLFAFLPLIERVSLWLLEPGVVLADAVLIKLVAAAPFLQSGGFIGVSWRRALAASLLGNSASYFVGVIASGTPWYVH